MTMKIPAHDHDRVMNMIAGIIERGDDKLVDADMNDARWVISLLLGQMGYKLHITEDGAAEIWPEGGSSSMEPGDSPFTAQGYREGEVAGKWYHDRAAYEAALAAHPRCSDCGTWLYPHDANIVPLHEHDCPQWVSPFYDVKATEAARQLKVAAVDVKAGDKIGGRTVRSAGFGADRIVIDFGDSKPLVCYRFAKFTVIR